MLKLNSKKSVAPKTTSKHDSFVNKSEVFHEYLVKAPQLKMLEAQVKALKAELSPLDSQLREDALDNMSVRKDFKNFKWIDEDHELTIIYSDRFPSKLGENVIQAVRDIGYDESEFMEYEYTLDTKAIAENTEAEKAVEALAEKFPEIFINKLKVKKGTMDKLREIKDQNLITVLRPTMSLKLSY
ncbi:MAG: hypothetical protein DRQ88_06075 [Epsilonproteobacteria bacterium]|nr:MAG: hypothetical protein DRQ88_06075 [Campylobacterota bacterium]